MKLLYILSSVFILLTLLFSCEKEIPEEPQESVITVAVIDTSNRAPSADFKMLNDRSTLYYDQTVTLLSTASDPENRIDSLVWTINGIVSYGDQVSVVVPSSGMGLSVTHRVVDIEGVADTKSVTYEAHDNPQLLVTLVSYSSANTGDGNDPGELFFLTNAICSSMTNDTCFTAFYPNVESGGTPFSIYHNQEVNFTQYSGLELFSGQVPDKLGISIISVDWDDPPGGFLSLIGDIVGAIGSGLSSIIPWADEAADVVVEVTGHVQSYLEENTDHDVIDQLNILLLKEDEWLMDSWVTLEGPNNSIFTIRIQKLND